MRKHEKTPRLQKLPKFTKDKVGPGQLLPSLQVSGLWSRANEPTRGVRQENLLSHDACAVRKQWSSYVTREQWLYLPVFTSISIQTILTLNHFKARKIHCQGARLHVLKGHKARGTGGRLHLTISPPIHLNCERNILRIQWGGVTFLETHQ